MTSICQKKISAEVRLIHAEQISLYKFHRFKKKQSTQLKTEQVKKDILNQWKSMGFPKLICSSSRNIRNKLWIPSLKHCIIACSASKC